MRLWMLLILMSLSASATGQALDGLIDGFDEAPPTGKASDDILDGFEDDSVRPAATSLSRQAVRRLRLGGYASLAGSWSYQRQAPAPAQADHRGLSRARAKAQLELDWRPRDGWQAYTSAAGYYDGMFALKGREGFTTEYLDSEEHELEMRELWLAWRLKRVDLRFGRQILAWGKSDSIRVVDVVNPLDFRVPGLVDIEDLRLPVTMLRSNVYAGSWTFTLALIPEIRQDRLPVYGSDYYPLPIAPPPEDVPETSLENTEFAFAASGAFAGWDLSLHAADTWQDQPWLAPQGPGMARRYGRRQMLGIASNVATGNWLLKQELAWTDGLRFFAGTGSYSRINGLVGADYSGFDNTTLSVEVMLQHINQFDAVLAAAPDYAEEDGGQVALRYSGAFWRERLQLTVLALWLGPMAEQGGLGRVSARYALGDALFLTVGGLVYKGGDSPFFQALARNDRLFAELRRDF